MLPLASFIATSMKSLIPLPEAIGAALVFRALEREQRPAALRHGCVPARRGRFRVLSITMQDHDERDGIASLRELADAVFARRCVSWSSERQRYGNGGNARHRSLPTRDAVRLLQSIRCVTTCEVEIPCHRRGIGPKLSMMRTRGLLYALLIGSCGGSATSSRGITSSEQNLAGELATAAPADHGRRFVRPGCGHRQRRRQRPRVRDDRAREGHDDHRSHRRVDADVVRTRGRRSVPNFRDRYLELADEHDEKDHRSRATMRSRALRRRAGARDRARAARRRPARVSRRDRSGTDPRARKTLSQDDKRSRVADQARVFLAKQLDREKKRRAFRHDPLEDDPQWQEHYVRWKKLDRTHGGIVAAAEARCEGWLSPSDADGSMTWRTGNAIEHVPAPQLPDAERAARSRDPRSAAIDSRELDFRLALRILRERVVEATGIIEDGTASAGPQPILGRMLDPAAMRAARGKEADADAAPESDRR